jgi:hypothetical protein
MFASEGSHRMYLVSGKPARIAGETMRRVDANGVVKVSSASRQSLRNLSIALVLTNGRHLTISRNESWSRWRLGAL